MPTNEPRVYLRLWNIYSEQAAAPQDAATYKNGVITLWDLNLQDYLHFFENVPEQAILEAQLRRYNTALPAAPIPGASAVFGADLARAFASVPEPAGLSVLALGACLMVRRGRRRK